MDGKFILLPQLDTFLKDLKQWVIDNFLKITDFNTWKSTLSSVSTSGKASDVAVDDTDGHFTGTNVEAVLEELYQDITDSGTIVDGSVTKVKLSSDVQQTLDKADTALQESDLQFATDQDIDNLFVKTPATSDPEDPNGDDDPGSNP